MSQATRIIDKFGGNSAMAKALGHRYPSTVQKWSESGFIQPHHYPAILTAAKDQGIDLSPEELAPTMAEAEQLAAARSRPDAA